MILYGFPLSPFVRKVLVTIKEKGIEAQMLPSNPSQPDEAFSRASPFHKIPAIEDGDFRLADSSAIVAYLDAKYPEPALIPADPEGRGRAIWFDEVIDTILIPAGAPIIVNRFLKPVIFKTEGDEDAAKAAEEAVLRPLDYLEGVLSTGGWLAGDYSIGDLSLACSIKTLSYAGWSLDAERYPSLVNWYARVGERAAWKLAAEQEAAVFASLGGSQSAPARRMVPMFAVAMMVGGAMCRLPERVCVIGQRKPQTGGCRKGVFPSFPITPRSGGSSQPIFSGSSNRST